MNSVIFQETAKLKKPVPAEKVIELSEKLLEPSSHSYEVNKYLISILDDNSQYLNKNQFFFYQSNYRLKDPPLFESRIFLVASETHKLQIKIQEPL